MSIFPKTSPTSFVDATQAALNSNEASKDNVFLTEEDLSKDGLTSIIMIAPNGSKWKKTVDNAGAWVTTAV